MQFIKNGPAIPERLLQLHEDGHVVFFCGAGISYPAGLPGFKGLVLSLYKNLGVTPNSVQKTALKARQYDTAIGLLEADHVGRRVAVRKELAAILNAASVSPEATLTHEALLTLGRCRNGRLRLVTTNFDRLFEAVIKRKGLTIETCQAPLLPIPKSRWNGLVYLHGLLSPDPSDNELDSLVVSSGDFGLAYLTERWAARFVSELFRHYTVCFVGYSLNDPVLRYMMDALAADRQRGESPHEMYAFGSYTKGREAAHEADWSAKNVIPILYRETKDHRFLHKTLRHWSDTYRDGARGKELIIIKEAIAKPLGTTNDDGFIGRVLWALSDESGLPAKRFAEMDPVPSLDWLKPLSEKRYRHSDLSRFGIFPNPGLGEVLDFSLIHRPAPYNRSPWMALCDEGTSRSQLDERLVHLARWMIRHLGDPALILWLVKRGGRLHNHFARLIEKHLDDIAKLEHHGKADDLNQIRVNAPRAIPSPLLRTVWRLLLSHRIRAGRQDMNLYHWKKRLERDGWSPSLRLSLRELLSPCIELREPFRWRECTGKEQEARHLKEIVDWELKLNTDHVHAALSGMRSSPRWEAVLPDLFADFNLLLRDTLDLMHELGSADERNDSSYVVRPSISNHSQNRTFHDWTVLIELTRDAWLALALRSIDQAMLIAQQWRHAPYPIFKRLAFFAAAQKSIVPPLVALDWLLADDSWWLWSLETKREALCLLMVLAPKLERADLGRLEEAILAGPPRSMFREDLDLQLWEQIVNHDVWLRLAKMTSAGASLGEKAKTAMDELATINSEWQLAQDQRDEFPFWMGGGDEWRKPVARPVATPRRRRELIEWLKHPDCWPDDDWRQRCRDQFTATAYALYAVSREDHWPIGHWREALQAWREEAHLERSWRYMAPVLARAPLKVIGELAYSLSWWLEALAKSFVDHQELFFALCLRVLDIEYKDVLDSGGLIHHAINHPVGQVTEALLNWWFRSELEDDQGLPDELEPIFTRLCDPQISAYLYARVLLAAHVISLFRVDSEWARRNLLPNFDWSRSALEARASWEGFLWSPRLYLPLFELIKSAFLDTAKHYRELGASGRQYAALLTFAALERETFITHELRTAIEALPEEGRQEVVRTLEQALEGSGEQRAEYWRNRVVPFWKSIWPKSRTYRTHALAGPLAELCIAAAEEFPQALNVLRDWLLPIPADSIIDMLDQGKLSCRSPEAALEFLDIVVDTRAQWPPHKLGKCLHDIKTADPGLEEDRRFRHLMEFVRRYE
jgi:SIR2-like domain